MNYYDTDKKKDAYQQREYYKYNIVIYNMGYMFINSMNAHYIGLTWIAIVIILDCIGLLLLLYWITIVSDCCWIAILLVQPLSFPRESPCRGGAAAKAKRTKKKMTKKVT